MRSLTRLISIIIIFFTFCKSNNGNLKDGSSLLERKISKTLNDAVTNKAHRQAKDLASKWPFFSDSVTVPNRKPSPHFGKPLKPKPNGPNQPVWSWNGSESDDKAISHSSIGWINMQTGCSSTVAATSYELSKTTITATETHTITSTSTEIETQTYTADYGYVALTPTASSSDCTGSTATETITKTDHTTSVTWQTETTTVAVTNTETSSSLVTSTSTVYNILTATTFVTSSVTVTNTSTVLETSTPDMGWSNPEATIVLEPSVVLDEVVSTITSTVSETPTLTVHVPSQTSVTTSIEIITETVMAPFSTTPPITVTEMIATSLNATVDTITSTILTSSPQCTITQYEYLSTMTTPSETITASFCGNPCGAVEKCDRVCFPKITTTSIDVTSTSIATAAQPIIVTYSATETRTSFTIEGSTLLTTKTVELTASPVNITSTSTKTAPVQVSTDTTQITITSAPTTITTTENLCTVTRFVTCSTTTTLPPVYVTIVDTEIIGVVGTVTSQTTSFTAPPIPTITSYIQGSINEVTATLTDIVVTDSRATTTTITKDLTTIGSGNITITPTKTIFNTKTAVVTSTPVITVTQIKKRTLMAEEYTTSVEETVQSSYVTPTSTNYAVIQVTPTPSLVTVSTLVVQMETTSSAGWKRPSHL